MATVLDRTALESKEDNKSNNCTMIWGFRSTFSGIFSFVCPVK